METRLDVARSLRADCILLYHTGDPTGTLAAVEDQKQVVEQLEAEHPNDEILSALAQSDLTCGYMLFLLGNSEERAESVSAALAIRQQLADAKPSVAEYQSDLAESHDVIGLLLVLTGKQEQALAAWRKHWPFLKESPKPDPRSLASNSRSPASMTASAGAF